MLEVELYSSGLGAEVEVKKLQELVRKLEQQNEQLRSRAGPEETLQYFLAGTGSGPETEDGSQPSVLDQLELLDLSSLSCWDESEETWLYASSRTQPAPHDALTPLQWCRQVLDRPGSVVEAPRLEAVAWGRGSLFCPSPFSSGPAPTRTSCSTPQSSEKAHAPPLFCSPRPPALQHSLSPVRRELHPSPPGRTPTRTRGGGVPLWVDGGLGSDVDDSMVQGFKLQDLLDVQVVARLQEDSLRQDLVRTSLAGAYSRSLGFLSAGSGLDEEDEDAGSSVPPWRPRPLATRLHHSQTFSGVRDIRPRPQPRPRSAPSTQLLGAGGWACWDPALGPGATPDRGSGRLQDFRPGLGALRRSLPNLTRAPSTPGVPIPPHPGSAPRCLHSSRSFDWSAGLPPRRPTILLQTRIPSWSSRLSKATAHVSPTLKGSWSSAPSDPRSNSPRPPASAGSAPRLWASQSARSFLTPPKTLWALRSPRDTSRRDCGF